MDNAKYFEIVMIYRLHSGKQECDSCNFFDTFLLTAITSTVIQPIHKKVPTFFIRRHLMHKSGYHPKSFHYLISDDSLPLEFIQRLLLNKSDNYHYQISPQQSQ